MLPVYKKYLLIYLPLLGPSCGTQACRSGFPTRDRTPVPCTGSVEF